MGLKTVPLKQGGCEHPHTVQASCDAMNACNKLSSVQECRGAGCLHEHLHIGPRRTCASLPFQDVGLQYFTIWYLDLLQHLLYTRKASDRGDPQNTITSRSDLSQSEVLHAPCVATCAAVLRTSSQHPPLTIPATNHVNTCNRQSCVINRLFCMVKHTRSRNAVSVASLPSFSAAMPPW